jgi:hypothetical protein
LPPAVEALLNNYVRPMSAGELILGAKELYQRNFRVLFFTVFILLVIPDLFIRPFVTSNVGALLFYLVSLLIGFIAFPACTITISDICVGNKPTVGRSYRYVVSQCIPLFAVFFLQTIIQGIGFILLIIPGVLFTLWYIIAQVVIILEKETGPIAALKRSRFLGRGYYGRNLALLFFSAVLLLIPMIIAGMCAGIAIAVFHFSVVTQGFLQGLITMLATALWSPYFYTLLVLIYYDLRARKEGYDSTALVESLRL